MSDLTGKWALVTGASSGFGVEFATLLAEQRANLVLAARRTEPMEKLAATLRQKFHNEVAVEGIDLSLPGAINELKVRLDARNIPVAIVKYWRALRYAFILARSLSTIQPVLKPLKLRAFDRSPKTVALGKRVADAVARP